MSFGAIFLAAALTNFTGVITFEREGLPFYFVVDSAGQNWRVAKAGNSAALGDVIEVSGERELSAKNRLATSSLKVVAKSSGEELLAKDVTIGEIFAGILPFGNPKWYGGVFRTEGLLRDINRRQATTQLLVGEGDRNLQVELPLPLDSALPANLVVGARVRVTGALAYTSIENFEEGIFGRIENVELIPMSKSDVEVVMLAPEPPFWTARRLGALFGIVGAFSAIMLAWVATLRKMVRRKTRELAESIRARETSRIEADAARRERLRLAADLHDGFQQYLAGAMFRLKAARNYLPENADLSREQLEKVQDALQHTQNGLRTTLWAMNEESEGPESLKALFMFVSRRMAHWEGIVHISSEGEERTVARNYCGSLLLVMQEAVGNAIRHGGARRVDVRIVFAEGSLKLSIVDDGSGFDPAAVEGKGHYGLGTMERRISELGGTMKISSKIGSGTQIDFTLEI